MVMEFYLTLILVFSIIRFPFGESNCAGKVYNFEIDLESDYQAQSFDGWVYNVQNGREWFYHSSWDGLPGTGVFLVDGNSGPVGEAFEVNGFFASYYLNPNLLFCFELKYYSTTDASLRNVIINGIPVPEHALQKSTIMEWTTIEFQARSPLLPKFPQIRIMMSAQTDNFFLIESLSTIICEDYVTSTATAPPTFATTETVPTPTVQTTVTTTEVYVTSTTSRPTSTVQTTTEGMGIQCPPVGIIFLPDPTDCAKFYICAEGDAYPAECAPGLLFDPQLGKCNIASEVRCGCPDEEGISFMPIYGTCQNYTICVNGAGTELSCAIGTEFSPVAATCVLASEYDCPYTRNLVHTFAAHRWF